MKTYFPDALTYMTMTLPINGDLRACFTVYLAFSLDKRITLPEGEKYLLQNEFPNSSVIEPHNAWGAMMKSLDEASLLDMGLPKLYGEWLMGGSACSPHGTQAKALPVSVRVGDIQRDFIVTGDAIDDGISIPDPQAFSTMPMRWKNAHGGLKHAENPLGKGIDKDVHGAKPLANISAKDCTSNETACPLGRNLMSNGFRGFDKWAPFPENMGTYDADWVENTWPAYPKDFDWSYYNLAQMPQRLPRPIADMGGFTGTEEIYISNMHPECPEIYGALPSLRVRLFLEYDNKHINNANQVSQWHEISPVADTVWLFPTQNVGLMLFHVTAPTINERNADILSFAAHLEDVHTLPAPAEECIQQAILLEEAVEVEPEEIIPEEIISKEIPVEVTEEVKKMEVPKLAIASLAVAIPSMPKIPSIPLSVPEPAIPIPTTDSIIQDSQADILEMVNVANAELKKFSLDPIQVDAVNAQMHKQLTAIEKMELELEKPQPELEEVFAMAGFSPEQTKNFMLASEMPMPSSDSFPNTETYEKALDEYLAKFGELTNAKPELLENMRKQTMLMDNPDPENLAKLFPDMALEPMDQLIKSGMSKAEAQTWMQAIDIPFPEDGSQMALLGYLKSFEKILSVPEGSMQGVAIKQSSGIQTHLYSNPDLIAELRSISTSDMGKEHAKPIEALAKRLEKIDATNIPKTPFDLSSLALECGVGAPVILGLLQNIDPMPLHTPIIKEEILEKIVKDELPKKEAIKAEGSKLQAPIQEEIPEEPIWAAPQNSEEFKTALRNGVDMTEYDLSGIDLSGLDLTDLNTPNLSDLLLDNAILTNALLGGAIMQNIQLSGAKCDGTNFSQCNLTSANLSESRLQNCNFMQSICTNTTFNESVIQNTSFAHAQLSHSIWEKSHIENCDFTHCDLSHSSWLESHFYAQTMEDVNLYFASFENCSLTESVFHGNLENITFENCDLTQVDFQNTILIKARFYHSNISQANLKDANLTNSNWWGMHGKSTRMPNAIAKNATFEECTLTQLHAPCLMAQECNWISCDLTEAQLKHTNLLNGSLRDCILAGADLSGASLFGADLYLMRPSPQTNLFNTDLTNTCLTRK